MICLRRGSWIRFWRWVSSHFKNVKKSDMQFTLWGLISSNPRDALFELGWISLSPSLYRHTRPRTGGALPGLVAHWWCHRVHITHSFTHWLNPDWNFPSSLLFKKKKKRDKTAWMRFGNWMKWWRWRRSGWAIFLDCCCVSKAGTL